MGQRYVMVVILMLVVAVGSFAFFMPLQTHAAGLVPCGGYEEDGSEEPPCDFNQLMIMANRITHFILFVLALPIATIMIAYAGFLFLVGGANPSKRSKARSILIKVVTGLLIAFGAWLIVNSILNALGVDDEAILLGRKAVSDLLLLV